MRRHQQQRRRPRRGSGQCPGPERGWRLSPSDRGAPGTNRGGKKAPVASCCSLSGAETQQEMGGRRRRGSGRFSPPRGFTDAYSSEPEAAAGEGYMGRQALAQMYGDETRAAATRKGKSGTSSPRLSKAHPRPASAHPRRSAAWPQPHLAPAGEGCATPCATSCTSLYGGELQAYSPKGRGPRVEDLLREDQWASPVPNSVDYGADASKPPSICPSSFSFTQHDKPAPKHQKKELKPGGHWQEPCESNPSTADLVHSLARPYEDEETQAYLRGDPTAQHRHQRYLHHHKARKGDVQINLQDLADKRYQDLIPERDKKIAALMLVRRQEEEEMKERQLRASEAWEQMKCKDRKRKARTEKERQYQLMERLNQWQRERDQRKAKLRVEEQQLLVAREKEMMLRDKKWKKLAKDQESRRRLKLDSSKLQADYKKHQERQLWDKRLNERTPKERTSQLYKEQMLQVLERRLMKEMEKKTKRTDMNEYKRARHLHVKEQVDDRAKAEELYKRLCIEQKLQRSQEILEQLIEERNRELKEKSSKEEEQGLIAKVRAKESEEEKRRRKEMLLQIAEMKIQQAKEMMTKNIQDRVQRTRDTNCMKERNHHYRKQKLDDDEKCHLREIQEAIRRKDQKSNQILRDKETAIEESRRIAKASYDLREKVRELMNHGSFEQKAFDAHRHAGLLRGL